jgi:DNA-binding NarL/FixJ family response regulator
MVADLIREIQVTDNRSGGRLTTREAQVLGLLRRGYATPAIARRLAISPVTVRRHISKAMHKLGHTTRTELSAAPENVSV